MTISERIKTRRSELRLSADFIASEIGVSPSTYREWENGRRIQGEPYLALAAALKIPLSELLGAPKDSTAHYLLEDLRSLEKIVINIRNTLHSIT